MVTMTAEVSALFPTGDQADETVRRTIDALVKGRGLTVEQAADMARINRATLYRRLGGKGSRQAFKAGEVAALARVLRVQIPEIYGGLGGVFVPPEPPPDGPPSPDPGDTRRSLLGKSPRVAAFRRKPRNPLTVPGIVPQVCGEDAA